MDEQNIQHNETAPVNNTPDMNAAQTTPSVHTKSNIPMIAIGAVVVAAILGGAYYAYTYIWNGSDSENAVAIVNGETITREAFDENVTSITENAALQGVDVADTSIQEEIRTQALEGLVNNALLIQGAASAGITVSDEEVQTEYQSIETQVGGSEELAKRMGEAGITTDELRTNIKDQLSVNAYLESQIDPNAITVSDEEIAAFIESLNMEEGQIPPLEEIRPQIEAQIQSQKQQSEVLNLIEGLREQAEVEILL